MPTLSTPERLRPLVVSLSNVGGVQVVQADDDSRAWAIRGVLEGTCTGAAAAGLLRLVAFYAPRGRVRLQLGDEAHVPADAPAQGFALHGLRADPAKVQDLLAYARFGWPRVQLQQWGRL